MKRVIAHLSIAELDQAHPSDEALQALGRSLEYSGFVKIEEHGVDLSLYPRAYELGRILFARPDAEKLSFVDPASMGLRGYMSLGAQLLDMPSYNRIRTGGTEQILARPNTINGSPAELWHVGAHPEIQKWPADLPEFQKVMSVLYQQLNRCSRVILRACGLYLSGDAELLEERTREGMTTLRLMKYPAPPADAPKKTNLGDSHEDVSLLTFFSEGESGGLSIQTPDEVWHPVVQEGNEIIVGVGDMLASLTNGLFRSGTHRVQYESDHTQSRMTMPFFVAPRADVSLFPLADCVSRSGKPPQFPKMTALEMLIESLKIGEHVMKQAAARDALTTPSLS